MNQRGASAAGAQICKEAFSCLSLTAAGSVETLFLFTLFELILAFIAGLLIWIFTYHYNILLYINNYIPWTAILAQKVLYKKNSFFCFFVFKHSTFKHSYEFDIDWSVAHEATHVYKIWTRQLKESYNF